MKTNLYRVTYNTVFMKLGTNLESRHTSPNTTLVVGQSPDEAFRLIPVPAPDEGESAHNVNLGVQITHRGLLAPGREKVEAT